MDETIERLDGVRTQPAPAAPHALPGSYGVEWVLPADLDRIAGAWRDLASRALEPNALLAPDFAIPAIRHLADAAGTRVAAVWRTDAAGSRLVGLWPMRASRHRWGIPLRAAVAMAHNYGPLSTPLIDRTHAVPAMDALVDALRSRPMGARLLLIPFLTCSGPVAEVLLTVLAARGLRHRLVNPFARALASPSTGAALGTKKRRELARQRRRLADLGDLSVIRASTPTQVADAVEAFLALEDGGWKGRAGTATLQRPDRAFFLRRAVLGMAREGAARILLLALGGRPIAAGIAFLQGGRAWFWKIAYDEAYGRFSPGVQLAVAMTDELLASGIDSIDSVADPGHPMIDHLWRERLEMADGVIDLRPGSSLLLDGVAMLERTRHAARHRLGRLRARLRGR
jgi:CelD/BcsL family acetyltransferase involved in cellulose biosynthesis